MNAMLPPLSPTGLAEILSELASEIEELGTKLCQDPAFALAHMADLQAIDHIAQKQRSIAALLIADCPMSAMDDIGLEQFKERLSDLHREAMDRD